ncbi:MAG TPA: L-glyceraldehyde 3-phosphate reductase [Chthoniobacterales bacterium]|jgi:L-glyceraldehyde 3-phosphate reductase
MNSPRYGSIPYRRSGRSGLLLPALSLGLWHNFGAAADFENARAMVRRAFDLGITHFDLANNYGPPPGSAEETFGRLLREDFSRHRDELIVSTKAGYTMWEGPYGDWGSRKYLLSSLDQSLHRLGLDYVDIFYHHRPDPDTPLEESLTALVDAVRMGKALYAGVSNYDAPRAAAAAQFLRAAGVPLLIHQPRYNMLQRIPETGGLLDTLDAEGVGCIAFCPLAQGLLTSRYLTGEIPPDSRAAGNSVFLTADKVTAENIAIARRLNPIAEARGQTLAQMALSWVLRRSTVTSALIGASRPSQIEENVAATTHCEFTAEELTAIDAACTGQSA